MTLQLEDGIKPMPSNEKGSVKLSSDAKQMAQSPVMTVEAEESVFDHQIMLDHLKGVGPHEETDQLRQYNREDSFLET
jgi:hypothetical protein